MELFTSLNQPSMRLSTKPYFILSLPLYLLLLLSYSQNLWAQPKPGPVTLLSPVTGMVMENRAGAVWNFDWTDASNATSYQILIEHTNKKDVLLNTEVRGSSHAFILPYQVASHLSTQAWGWWVRARNGATWGPWSKPFTLYLPEHLTATPPQPYAPYANTVMKNGNRESDASYTWTFRLVRCSPCELLSTYCE